MEVFVKNLDPPSSDSSHEVIELQSFSIDSALSNNQWLSSSFPTVDETFAGKNPKTISTTESSISNQIAMNRTPLYAEFAGQLEDSNKRLDEKTKRTKIILALQRALVEANLLSELTSSLNQHHRYSLYVTESEDKISRIDNQASIMGNIVAFGNAYNTTTTLLDQGIHQIKETIKKNRENIMHLKAAREFGLPLRIAANKSVIVDSILPSFKSVNTEPFVLFSSIQDSKTVSQSPLSSQSSHSLFVYLQCKATRATLSSTSLASALKGSSLESPLHQGGSSHSLLNKFLFYQQEVLSQLIFSAMSQEFHQSSSSSSGVRFEPIAHRDLSTSRNNAEFHQSFDFANLSLYKSFIACQSSADSISWHISDSLLLSMNLSSVHGDEEGCLGNEIGCQALNVALLRAQAEGLKNISGVSKAFFQALRVQINKIRVKSALRECAAGIHSSGISTQLSIRAISAGESKAIDSFRYRLEDPSVHFRVDIYSTNDFLATISESDGGQENGTVLTTGDQLVSHVCLTHLYNFFTRKLCMEWDRKICIHGMKVVASRKGSASLLRLDTNKTVASCSMFAGLIDESTIHRPILEISCVEENKTLLDILTENGTVLSPNSSIMVKFGIRQYSHSESGLKLVRVAF